MGLCPSRWSRLAHSCPAPKRTFHNATRLVYVVSVYDGDTITIRTNLTNAEPLYEYPLRLYGIDAPELKPLLRLPNRAAHIAAAQQARDALKDQVENQVCLVEFTKEEKYGRLLGTLWTLELFWPHSKKLNVNQWMLEQGYARPYTGQGPKPE